ncbi:MAG TPA: hypothetical protein VLU46_14040, partial [Thermoanaerobaculia bacterium]|nr:hypothetical protein [Thermoanaerobaculia bacterium]
RSDVPEVPAAQIVPVTITLPPLEPPPAEPSAEVPTLVEAANSDIVVREKALASELGRMWTRHPEELVKVIDEASRSATVSPSVTLLLAIAHAETNGQILDISEAGAVGLAQATPIACRQEQFDGRLYVTGDYLDGARAYLMKKPLGDADTIASLIVDHDNAKTRKKAKRLLRAAFELRLEGVEELDLLDPWADDGFTTDVKQAKLHNLHTLQRLEVLLDHGTRAQLRTFRNHARDEYRDLKRTQLESWERYQRELIARRDSMLQNHFGIPASEVKATMPYEAGEYLAGALDERFSAKQMAAFLVQHLERKSEEARELARSGSRVEEMTAALYNGGSHNVKRMLAGLIVRLPETQNYMKKVPATRRRLDRTIADVRDPLQTVRTEAR